MHTSLRGLATHAATLIAGMLATALLPFDLLNLQRSIILPSVRISEPVRDRGQCSFKLWAPRESEEKAHVRAYSTCSAYALCVADPCPDKFELLPTIPTKGGSLFLTDISETTFSTEMPRQLVFDFCSECPDDVVVSTAAHGSSGLVSQRYRSRTIGAGLALLLTLVLWLAWTSKTSKAFRRTLRARRLLTPEDRTAWSVERQQMADLDLIDVAEVIRVDVQNMWSDPTNAELRAVATKYKQELRSGIAERFSPQGERSANWRRNQYKAADKKRSWVG